MFKGFELGEHVYVQFDKYVTVLRKNKKESLNDILINLEENYLNIKKKSKNSQQALINFAQKCGAKIIDDWVGYKFDLHFLSLFKYDGCEVEVPLINKVNSQYFKLKILFWKEEDDDIYYSVLFNEQVQGTIVNKENVQPSDFFKNFLGKLFFINYFNKDVDDNLFCFSSMNLRKDFNFLPALVCVEGVN